MVVLFGSLIFSVIRQGGCVNIICLILSLLVTPYYLFWMGPAEDRMVDSNLSSEETLASIRIIGWGHLLLLAVGGLCLGFHLWYGTPIPGTCPVAHVKKQS